MSVSAPRRNKILQDEEGQKSRLLGEIVIHENKLRQDLNDCWNETKCVETEIAKRYIEEFNQTYGKIDLFIDWHGGNLGQGGNDAILYETDVEKELATKLILNSTFLNKAKYLFGQDQLNGYVHKTYNTTSITMEILQKDEETTHQIPRMKEEGRKVLYSLLDITTKQEEINITEQPKCITIIWEDLLQQKICENETNYETLKGIRYANDTTVIR